MREIKEPEVIKLVVGCNYHTTWQANKKMRFVLVEVKGERARLKTRTTGKDFWTDTKDLIFITTECNVRKAATILRNTPSLEKQ